MKRVIATALFACACGNSTGSALVTFSAVASGPGDATGESLTFENGLGAAVTLTRARLHLGAVYLNQSLPVSGAASAPCISPGIYVGEVMGPLDVDLLSPVARSFPQLGEGTETQAKTAEIWLSGGDIDAPEDPSVILDVAGSAVQGGQMYPFSARLTIGSNREPRVTNPALPGANAICHERIVTPIAVSVTPTDGGKLVLEIDPRAMFRAVDFSSLSKSSASSTDYIIPDDDEGAGEALFKGVVANSGVYTFAWEPTR